MATPNMKKIAVARAASKMPSKGMSRTPDAGIVSHYRNIDHAIAPFNASGPNTYRYGGDKPINDAGMVRPVTEDNMRTSVGQSQMGEAKRQKMIAAQNKEIARRNVPRNKNKMMGY